MDIQTENPRDLPYRGGFVMTCETPSVPAHFMLARTLPGGWQLWVDKGDFADISTAVDEFGRFVVVYGRWCDLNERESSDIANELLRQHSISIERFHKRLSDLVGRFFVATYFSSLRIYNDPIGLRSVYYSLDSKLISSHLNLLLMTEDHESRILSTKVVNMYLDETIRFGVRQLLPNHLVEIGTYAVERYFPVEENKYDGCSQNDRLELVEILWDRYIGRHLSKYPNVCISVTGGLDSRWTLAMSAKYMSKMRSFTYGMAGAGNGTKWSRAMNMDYEIVQQLIPYIGTAKHDFIKFGELSPLTEEIRNAASLNSTLSHGRNLLPAYRELFPEQDWFHLRGNGVEIVRKYWGNKTDDSAARVLRMLQHENPYDVESRFCELNYDGPHHGYRLWDLTYWELRMGRWLSEIMNETDVAFDTFLPVGSRVMIEALLSAPEDIRESGADIRELINRNNPVLNFVGTNDRRNLYEQIRDAKLLERRQADEKRSTAEFKNVTLYTGSTDSVDIASVSSTLALSTEMFREGNSIRGIVHECSTQFGSVQFQVSQRYASRLGGGNFALEIYVNDERLLAWDGSTSSLKVHVTVTGLNRGDVVKLGVCALQDRDAKSWENATISRVSEVRPIANSRSGELEATADIPRRALLNLA